jgi:hypothetical protein
MIAAHARVRSMMRAASIAGLIGILAASHGAVAHPLPDACAPVVAACQAFGFIRGAGIEGNQLEADCVRPIAQGRVPRHVSKPLPPLAPGVAQACRDADRGDARVR